MTLMSLLLPIVRLFFSHFGYSCDRPRPWYHSVIKGFAVHLLNDYPCGQDNIEHSSEWFMHK